jgi:valyl-tRNA synthetase
LVDFLKERDLYRGTTDNPMRLGISSRSKDVIEPLLKPQWWVACGDMAARSCKAVRDGDLEIIPKV